ncbi:MAG: hypothetical protein E3J71_03165 [Candidatus Stahlbacteria bacterium]|nr:MAG: hypothetical protein E3J71_03165 [Candidatus Stahlbacteria bacterium]
MMNVFKQITILCLTALVVSTVVCKKEVKEIFPLQSEPHWLIIIREQGLDSCEEGGKKIDVTDWEIGKDALIFSRLQTDVMPMIAYPWQGEDTISYYYDGWELRINGKMVGVHLNRWGEPEADVENPADIICIGSIGLIEADSFKTYPNLRVVMVWFQTCHMSGHFPLRLYNLKDIPTQIDLYVDYKGIRHADVRGLSKFHNLKGFTGYFEDRVGTRSLRYVRRMKNLRGLKLGLWGTNDDRLRYLASLEHLQRLTLKGLRIGDKGLRHLAKIRSLKSLTLIDYQPITFRDIPALLELAHFIPWLKGEIIYDFFWRLRLLPYDIASVFVNEITHEGWLHLVDLPNLRELNLRQVEVTDKDLEGIGFLSNLRVLHLSGSSITDEGLINLERLKNLGLLEISSLKLTAGGISKLQESLPNCEIRLCVEPSVFSSGFYCIRQG